MPEEWDLATVVEIYKGKGSHGGPEMYRPISLLNTTYKVLARILQKRLEAVVEGTETVGDVQGLSIDELLELVNTHAPVR